MTIGLWFWPALAALLLWGVTSFLPKLAVRTLPPLHLTVYAAGFSSLVTVAVLGFYGFQLDTDPRGIFLAVLIGILGRLGYIFFTVALRDYSMTHITVVTSLYPVIATGLSFFILHEGLAVRQMAGIVLGTGALILMVVASDGKEE